MEVVTNAQMHFTLTTRVGIWVRPIFNNGNEHRR